ncbi:MAG: hypothetical protein ACUVWA_08095 [Candidatus Oleimicrobiaceae bacterium]
MTSATTISLIAMDIEALAIALQHPTTFCVGPLNKDVYKGPDGVTGWVNIRPTAMLESALAIDPQKTRTLYAGTNGQGAHKSNKGGCPWSVADGGLGDGFVCALAINPVSPATLYADTETGTCKGIADGETWRPANWGLTTAEVLSLAINSRNPFLPEKRASACFHLRRPNGVEASYGLANLPFLSLSISQPFLFAGISGKGLWRQPPAEMSLAHRRRSFQ